MTLALWASQVLRENNHFYQPNSIIDVKFVIGWTLANAGDATLEYKSCIQIM